MIVYMCKFPNDKMYIGKTIYDLEHRKNQHLSDMKRDKNSKVFYNAIKKYGWDNLNWYIIDISNTEEELLEKEKYWIEYYNTYIHFENSMGYNTTLGGEGTSGYMFSEELKQQMSERTRGENNPFYGRNHSQSTKEKQSKIKIGKYEGKHNPNYNNKWNNKQKQHNSELNKGKLIGENNPAIIITETIAKEIKIRLSKGETIINISDDLNISYDIVSNIKLLKCWNDLLPELNEIIQKFKQKRTKITLEIAKEIKIRLSNGDNSIDIINDLQVTKDNVFNIKYLKNYKNLLPELNEVLIKNN